MAVGASGLSSLFWKTPVTAGNVAVWDAPGVLGDGGFTPGSVTSVALSLPASVFSISGSPVTTTGTLTGSFINQTANTVFAGPTTGADAAPAFRALVNADFPDLLTAGSAGSSSSIPVISWNAKGLLTVVATASISVPTGANPSASVGLSAVNGSASTFMRSDAAPALSQSITPTWSGLHTFNNGINANTVALGGAPIGGNALAAAGNVAVTSSDGNTSTFTVTNTASSFGIATTAIYAPNLSNGNGMALFFGGKAASNNNSFGVNYEHSGNGSTSNRISFNFYGADNLLNIYASGNIVQKTGSFGFGNGGITATTMLTGPATATLQLGAADAASPVAQTLQAQGSRAGTDTNVGGGDFTVQPGTGTGTGTGASLILKAPALAASGSGAQTQTEVARILGGTTPAFKWTANNSTGAGSALLGTNSPASTLTAPYTWVQVITGDGSTGYMPIWK